MRFANSDCKACGIRMHKRELAIAYGIVAIHSDFYVLFSRIGY